jgi:hypothetical protein
VQISAGVAGGWQREEKHAGNYHVARRPLRHCRSKHSGTSRSRYLLCDRSEILDGAHGYEGIRRQHDLAEGSREGDAPSVMKTGADHVEKGIGG